MGNHAPIKLLIKFNSSLRAISARRRVKKWRRAAERREKYFSRFAKAHQEGHIDPIHLVVAVINNIAASRGTRLEGLELERHGEIYGRWLLGFPGKDVPTIPYSVLEDGWDQALNMGVLRRKHPDTADLTRGSIVIVEAKAGDVLKAAQLLSARHGRVWVKNFKPLLEFARRYWPISLTIVGAIVWLAQHLL